jgi:hypothetical protein
MNRLLFLLAVVFIIAACAPTIPTRPPDPAYHFTPGATFELALAETLEHRPSASREHPMIRASSARYDLTVVAVRPDGAAHLLLKPAFGETVLTAQGQPPVSFDMWGNHPRDPDDHSEGARYIGGAVDEGLHVVVDNEGLWLRDFRGFTPPADFLQKDKWPRTPGLTVYPNRDLPKWRPAWLTTFVSVHWRRDKMWRWVADYGVFPPMTGFLPVELQVRVTRREGSLLYLTGEGRQTGATRTQPALGLVMQGDRTETLEFASATYNGRFDLELGMPIESHFVLAWKSTRMVETLGEVPANDHLELVFRLRKKS